MRIMGIDVGINKVAVSVWDGDTLVGTEAFTGEDWGRSLQLSDIYDFIYDTVYHAKVETVVVEETLIGNNRKYSIKLSQTIGAVLAALGQYEREFGDLETMLVNVSTWKKEVIGDGRADKAKVQDWMYAKDSAYAELCGRDQDRFDAAAIGYYGYIISERAIRLLANLGRLAD